MFVKVVALIVLVLFIGIVSSQLYVFWKKERGFAREFRELEGKFEEARQDHEELTRELQYLAQPVNLEKELRARFNFRRSDETMLIIVPPPASSSPTSSRP